MFSKAIAAGLLLAGTPGIALAHHAMDGRLPDTLASGLLSGLGHPLIGWDHSAFVIGVGVLCAVTGLGTGPILAFVLGTVGGCLLHLAGTDVPAAETAVGLSLLALAAMVALRWRERTALLAALALAGMFHGYAYGESIFGAEPTPVLAYLAGFAIMQGAVALGVWRSLTWLGAPGTAAAGLAGLSAMLLVLAGTASLFA